MAPNFKKAKNILHIGLFGLSIIFSGLVWNYMCIQCSKHLYWMQSVDAAAGGYSIIMFVVFVGLLCEEEFQMKTQLALSYMAAILHLLAFLILCHYGYKINCKEARYICATIFCLLLLGLHLFEAIYITVKKEMDEEV